jgi:transcriptional accessory protein Tex/SPT6
VNINTANFSLLSEIPGISDSLARNIIRFRSSRSAFVRKEDLLDVMDVDPVVFANVAGFARIVPHDATARHPGNFEASEVPAVSASEVCELRAPAEWLGTSEGDGFVWGTVRNVVDFGIFVDIGDHRGDGLVHRSEIIGEHTFFSVGERIRVRTLRKNPDKVALTMK